MTIKYSFKTICNRCGSDDTHVYNDNHNNELVKKCYGCGYCERTKNKG